MSDDFMDPSPSTSTENAGVKTNVARRPEAFIGELFKSQVTKDKKIYAPRKIMKGVVLYCNTIQLKTFINRFDADFATYVLGSKTVNKSDLPRGISYVYEAIVYVPEISGCLPFPDMRIIEEFVQKLRDEIEGLEPDPDFKKLSKKAKISKYEKFRKSLDRMDRFPRFYCTTRTATRTPARGQVVSVSFLDDGDWASSGVIVSAGGVG